MSKPKKPRPVTDFDVVFYDNGDLAWRSYVYNGGKTEKNHVFSDTIGYEGFARNYVQLKSLNSGRKYLMFLSDFDEVIQAKRFIDNQIVGNFCFCRKGRSQGIRLILEP